MKQRIRPAPELASVNIAEKAVEYLSRYFQVNGGYDLRVVERGLPNDLLGRFNPQEGLPLYVVEIDEKKLMKKLRKENIEDKFDFFLDMVVGEEIGNLLFYLAHKEMHNQGLSFVQEAVGRYCGIVYANRDSSEPSFLELSKNGIVDSAEEIYRKYRDTKLAELGRAGNKTEFDRMVESYSTK